MLEDHQFFVWLNTEQSDLLLLYYVLVNQVMICSPPFRLGAETGLVSIMPNYSCQKLTFFHGKYLCCRVAAVGGDCSILPQVPDLGGCGSIFSQGNFPIGNSVLFWTVECVWLAWIVRLRLFVVSRSPSTLTASLVWTLLLATPNPTQATATLLSELELL